MLIRRQPSFTIHHLHFKSQHPLHQVLLQRIFQHLPFFELIFRLGLSLKATTSQLRFAFSFEEALSLDSVNF
jgi:hypothetical protein